MEWEWGYAALVILGAAIVRGYSGFGFAMIVAVALGFVFSPSTITPMVLILDLSASFWLYLRVGKQVDWPSLKWIGLGTLPTLGLGSLALTLVAERPMRIAIALLVLGLCLILSRTRSPWKLEGRIPALGAGLCSGFLSGMAALGGPPVILYYFSSDRPVAQSRATMITFFLIVDFFALVSCAFYGLVDTRVVGLGTAMMVPSFAGLWVGNRLFEKFAREKAFKSHVIRLLMAISLVSLIRFTLFA